MINVQFKYLMFKSIAIRLFVFIYLFEKVNGYSRQVGTSYRENYFYHINKKIIVNALLYSD